MQITSDHLQIIMIPFRLGAKNRKKKINQLIEKDIFSRRQEIGTELSKEEVEKFELLRMQKLDAIDEGIRKIELGLIFFINKINNFLLFVMYNKLFVLIKDLFYNIFGTPYPVYLYNKELDDYVSGYSNEITTDLQREVNVATVEAKGREQFAIDFSKYWIWKRNAIKKWVNKAWKEQGGVGTYYFKRVITYTKQNKILELDK